jgi:SAM-dependent methyltransferase
MNLGLPHTPNDLAEIYQNRFAGRSEYREKVWTVLCTFFSKWIHADAIVLDLGCGYCEFINNISARRKYAMDLNPAVNKQAAPGVMVLQQDCSAEWQISPNSLDVIFTSNFLEHLPDKGTLERTIHHAALGLRRGGHFVLMGPNIKYLPGAYWDFFDHYIPLTELSLIEILKKCGFEIEVCRDRFLPYTMSEGREYPVWMLKAYLALPFAWRFFGKQFLLVARRK